MNRIKELREAKGWSQMDLAIRARRHLNTVRNLEGGGIPLKSTARAIAKALGVGVKTVFPQ